jgi:hypothetical protein
MVAMILAGRARQLFESIGNAADWQSDKLLGQPFNPKVKFNYTHEPSQRLMIATAIESRLAVQPGE